MYFQTIDDKSECVGIYTNGRLHFDDFPTDLTRTWRYGGSLKDKDVEYAWIRAHGKDLRSSCPEELSEEFEGLQRKMRAYIKTFRIAKVNLNEHCIFDLVPHDFLARYCDAKNQITEHVFETTEKPANYDHLVKVHKLLYNIRQNRLNLSTTDCRNLLLSSQKRMKAQDLCSNYSYIDYNLFGTATGRLTTLPGTFPVLTLKKEFRKLLKPNNDLFVALDYNGAEVRTFIELCGADQPDYDIHEWNVRNVFSNSLTRDEAKVEFFAWLYNPDSDSLNNDFYDKKKLLDKWYEDGYITTPYQRKIEVDDWRAMNYLIQSTTADRVLAKAAAIDEMLEDKKSFVSHILHDEVVIDYSDEDRPLIKDIKAAFEDGYLSTVKAGKNYFELTGMEI